MLKLIKRCLLFVVIPLVGHASQSSRSVNIVGVPDPIFGSHMIGLEGFFKDNFKLGFYFAEASDTDRPTFELPNDDVTNNYFRRRAVGFSYAWKGIDQDGPFVGAVFGTEESHFESEQGSVANVTFEAYGLHTGWQFFWTPGFNIILTATMAFYEPRDVEKNYVSGESSEVERFLDKNTKCNFHPGIGVLFGWAI